MRCVRAVRQAWRALAWTLAWTLPWSLSWAPSARAQEPAALALATLASEPPLTEGMTLRVRAGPRRLTGRLREVRGDTLRLATGPFHTLTMRATLTAATRLEVRDGPRSRVRGAAIGAGAGLVGGLLLGATIVHAFRGDVGDVGPVSSVFLPYSVGAGAVAGALFPGHRWHAVRLTPRS